VSRRSRRERKRLAAERREAEPGEAVAWLAQRKDVVCLFFYAGSILAYVKYAREEARPWRWYAAAMTLSALAMLSKGYAVVLPGVLMAYDLCFTDGFSLGRIRSRLLYLLPFAALCVVGTAVLLLDTPGLAIAVSAVVAFAIFLLGGFPLRQALDKLPFVALAAAATAATALVQGKASALVEINITPWQRSVALAKIFAVYAGRSLMPVGLSARYIVGTAWLSWWVAALGVMLGAAAVAGFVLLRRRAPAAAFGIALFMLPLVTVMNTFWTLRIWMADRYLFFPTIGSSLALAAAGLWLSARRGVPEFGERSRAASIRRLAIPSAAALAVAVYSALTVARIGVWTSPVALWSDALRKQTGVSGSGPLTRGELDRIVGDRGKLAHLDAQTCSALASAYGKTGDEGLARALLIAMQRGPEGASGGEIELARELISAGSYDEAVVVLRPVVEGGTWLAPYALVLTGRALRGKGEVDAARRALVEADELYKGMGRSGIEAMRELGALEFIARRYAEAASWYALARDAAPRDPHAVFFLGRAFEETGQLDRAYRLYEEALALRSATRTALISPADIHKQMGIAAQKLGRVDESIAHFEELLRLVPEHPERDAVREKIRMLRSRPRPRSRRKPDATRPAGRP
jgi:tetratricopeptide (TPR) repeat protein